jgi:hypothetical protein
MTKPGLRFQVDSRLATLLSQEYASSEKTLKELVDNAWDADAEQVLVSLPRPMGDAPIVITDDGCGMTEEELRRHYLFIATDRRSRRGDKTAGKNRWIKGRKGIGKFAGLMTANGSPAPLFESDDHRLSFVIRLPVLPLARPEPPEVAPEVTHEVTPEVGRVVVALQDELSRAGLQQALDLKDEKHFRKAYLLPALDSGLVEMTRPETPRSSKQRYRLTALGQRWLDAHAEGRAT